MWLPLADPLPAPCFGYVAACGISGTAAVPSSCQDLHAVAEASYRMATKSKSFVAKASHESFYDITGGATIASNVGRFHIMDRTSYPRKATLASSTDSIAKRTRSCGSFIAASPFDSYG